jgi:hypothetical protein
MVAAVSPVHLDRPLDLPEGTPTLEQALQAVDDLTDCFVAMDPERLFVVIGSADFAPRPGDTTEEYIQDFADNLSFVDTLTREQLAHPMNDMGDLGAEELTEAQIEVVSRVAKEFNLYIDKPELAHDPATARNHLIVDFRPSTFVRITNCRLDRLNTRFELWRRWNSEELLATAMNLPQPTWLERHRAEGKDWPFQDEPWTDRERPDGLVGFQRLDRLVEQIQTQAGFEMYVDERVPSAELEVYIAPAVRTLGELIWGLEQASSLQLRLVRRNPDLGLLTFHREGEIGLPTLTRTTHRTDLRDVDEGLYQRFQQVLGSHDDQPYGTPTQTWLDSVPTFSFTQLDESLQEAILEAVSPATNSLAVEDPREALREARCTFMRGFHLLFLVKIGTTGRGHKVWLLPY